MHMIRNCIDHGIERRTAARGGQAGGGHDLDLAPSSAATTSSSRSRTTARASTRRSWCARRSSAALLDADEARELSRRDAAEPDLPARRLDQGRRRRDLGPRRRHGRRQDEHRAAVGHHRRRVERGARHEDDDHAADHARHHPGARHSRRGAHLRDAAQLGARERCASTPARCAHHRAARGDERCAGRRCRWRAWRSCSGSSGPTSRACRSKQFVVVVGLAQHRIGLVVDELRRAAGHRHQVARARARGVPGIAGATELGGKKTVLVLDVAPIVEEAVGDRRRQEAADEGSLSFATEETYLRRHDAAAHARAARHPHASPSAARSTASRSCRIREIIKLREITEVPRAPRFLLGVVTVRGLVMPVVDLRAAAAARRAPLDARGAHPGGRCTRASASACWSTTVRGVVRFADERDRAAAAVARRRRRRRSSPASAAIPTGGEERMVILLVARRGARLRSGVL